MAKMRILIRIVFVIFIANGIDCLGSDICCIHTKYENISKEGNIIKDENIIAESLVNKDWFNAKKDNPVLKIFKKEDDNDIFTSTENEDKISIKLEEKDNPKIAYLQKKGEEDPLKLGDEKYALFEIKIQEGENTVYLYCSDVESIKYKSIKYKGILEYEEERGIFELMEHKSISVIACDTEKVKNMRYMFSLCKKVINLNLNNFSTTNVTNMAWMFSGCSSLTELKFDENFNTTNVTNMSNMFSGCSNLTELKFGDNFNTTNVTNMSNMFSGCSSLINLDLSNFNTSKVKHKKNMFDNCNKLPEDIRNKFSNKNE